MADTTGQQSSTVAHDITRNPASIWLSPMCDETADHGEGRTWAAPAPAETCEDCSEPWVEYVRSDLASVSSASAEGIKACIALCEHMEADKSLPDEAGNAAWNLKVAMRHLLNQASASPEPVPATNQVVKWRERWYGSEPQKGSAIVDERGNLIAYFGGDETTHKATTAAVSAHNASIATQPATSQEGARGDFGVGQDELVAGLKRALQHPAGDHDGWTDAGMEDAFFRWPVIVNALNEALAVTKPATSQEGEAAKYADMDIAERATAMADDCVGDPWELLGFFREKLRQSEANAEAAKAAAIGFAQRLAATPTPPTLSEDLREVLQPFADAAADYDYHDGQPAFDEYPDASSLPEINDLTVGNLRAARAALAQVKPS